MTKAEIDKYIGIKGYNLTKFQKELCRIKAGLFSNELAVSLAKLYHSRNYLISKEEIYQ